VNWSFLYRVGLAWTGLTFATMYLVAFRPLARHFWVLPAATVPLAVAFVQRGYSVRRLWTFALTTYGLFVAVMLAWVIGLVRIPVTTNRIEWLAFGYGTVVLAFVVSYALVYRGGYSRLKRFVIG
jgi:hypothetical protein